MCSALFRFAYDGLKRQRLVEPLVRLEGEEQLTPATWEEALFTVSDKVSACLIIPNYVPVHYHKWPMLSTSELQ